MVSSAVKLIIAQRLVRRICTECKEEIPVREAERKEIDEAALEEIEASVQGPGMQKVQRPSVYKGRAPVFELMPIKSMELKKIITEAGTEVQISQIARKRGDKNAEGLRHRNGQRRAHHHRRNHRDHHGLFHNLRRP